MMWKDSYKVGVALIDEQHEELFRRVSDFVLTVRAVDDGDKAQKVEEALKFMEMYVVVHFHDEEQFQKEIGYPALETHQKAHNQLVEVVMEVSEQFKNEGYNHKVMQQFSGRMLAWLINHVASADQKIADYIREKEGKIDE